MLPLSWDLKLKLECWFILLNFARARFQKFWRWNPPYALSPHKTRNPLCKNAYLGGLTHFYAYQAEGKYEERTSQAPVPLEVASWNRPGLTLPFLWIRSGPMVFRGLLENIFLDFFSIIIWLSTETILENWDWDWDPILIMKLSEAVMTHNINITYCQSTVMPHDWWPWTPANLQLYLLFAREDQGVPAGTFKGNVMSYCRRLWANCRMHCRVV